MQTFTQGQENSFKDILHQRLNTVKRIVLTSHKGPDDDSISSILGLYYYIRAEYPSIETKLVYASEYTGRWNYFDGYKDISFGVDPSSLIKENIDLFMITDACEWGRVSKDQQLPVELNDRVLAIDHHKNQPEEGIISYIRPQCSSCSEIIYELFYKSRQLTKEISEILLLGILGDTGSFTYINPQQTNAFTVAERLVREGEVDIQAMKSTYMGYSEEVYRILAFLMNRTEIIHDPVWGAYSVSYISREEALTFTSSDNEVHAAAAGIYSNTYTKSITGIMWGFVVYPTLQEERYNVSARSLPQGVNVRALFQGMGVGGGHDLASGGKFIGAKSPEEVIKKIQSYLSTHKPTRFDF